MCTTIARKNGVIQSLLDDTKVASASPSGAIRVNSLLEIALPPNEV